MKAIFGAFVGVFILSAATAIPAQNAAAQTSGAYVNVVELDLVPEQRDAFLTAAKENAAASLKEPGCQQYNIIAAANNPNHVVLVEIYDNEAAIQSHRTTDHFKKYQATTGSMVAKREVRPMTSIVLQSKAH
jgi:autoinducer 2-degrading protein